MTTLEQIAEIKIGYPGQTEKEGELVFLQVRQFDENGKLNMGAIDYLSRDDKTHYHILKAGDVLFVGKGNRLFAWCYKEATTPTVASSSFFVLRPHTNKVDPEYLTAILNAPQTKAVFQQIGGGTNIFSIRKSELEVFQLPVPSMQQQKNIAALTQLHQKDMELTQQLLIQKQHLYTAIISKLIK